MKITLVLSDITSVKADVIVNAANSSLLGGSGVDGAIHRKGGIEILRACQEIRNKQGKCDIGEAVITTAGNLDAQYVIHTVGPVWNLGGEDKKLLLSNCYKNSMRLAIENKLSSIAFPSISTGIYRFPKGLAAQIAVQSIEKFKDQNIIEEVIFVCFEKENFEIYEKVISEIGKGI